MHCQRYRLYNSYVQSPYLVYNLYNLYNLASTAFTAFKASTAYDFITSSSAFLTVMPISAGDFTT
jgi:hypothetical protein